MISSEIQDAFYTSKRSETYPLAVNDIVTIKEGRNREVRAWVISIKSEAPEVTYLVEYEDGTDEIRPLAHLQLR